MLSFGLKRKEIIILLFANLAMVFCVIITSRLPIEGLISLFIKVGVGIVSYIGVALGLGLYQDKFSLRIKRG